MFCGASFKILQRLEMEEEPQQVILLWSEQSLYFANLLKEKLDNMSIASLHL